MILWSSKCHVYFMTNYDLVQLAHLKGNCMLLYSSECVT